MVAPPHRTLLEMLVRESRWTIEETCAAFEKKARDLGEQASLSSRQLSRWMRGEVGRPRPVMQRVSEKFWGHTFDVLLGPPERQDDTPDRHLATLDHKRLGTTAEVPSGTVIESGSQVISARLGHDTTEQTRTSAMPGLPGHDGLESTLQRRILLQQAMAALAAGTVPALDVVREGLAGSGGVPTNQLDADEWASVAQDYERAYYTHSPEELVISLATDVGDLQHSLRTAAGPVQRDLLRVGAQLAALMAMSLVNLGQFQPARRWWRTSRHASDESGDTAVRVWVRGQDAMHAMYEQRSLALALGRADEAIAISGRSVHPGTAEALGARAQALALLRRADAAREAAHHLSDAFGRLPDAATRTATIMSGWPERRLWHAVSYVHTQIGDGAEAAAAQERALALIPDTAPRSRAQVGLHTAHCLVRDGHIDGGLHHARAVITALPPQQRTALVTNVGQQVLDAVPEKERSRPAAADLRELLRAAQPHRIRS